MDTKLPEVIDLFSGCGGLSLGFQSEGFNVTHGIELMTAATETVSYNEHWRFGKESGHICGSITDMSPDIWKDKIGKNGCIVIGGPPCQAYSLAGRAKLASLGEKRKNTNDARGYLFEDYLRFVYGLNAKAVVMENVPESTNYGGMNVPQKVCDSLRRHGYKAKWTILNAADFGVPQIRERVILIAVKKDLGFDIDLPVPTHKNPEGKKTQNQMRFKSFEENRSFTVPHEPSADAKNWVTVGEALGDLPVLFKNENQKYILERTIAEKDYRTKEQNDYQHVMRNWYGHPELSVTGNCFRRTERDFPIFARMKEGDNYSAAAEIADHLFEEACEREKIYVKAGEDYEKLKKKIVPPYARDKFLAKWQKLQSDKPSHTLVAHLSVDTYSHIHPKEPRGISVREAARLQSFPDGFLFQCSMGDAFKQIGNAVPPLLSKAVAHQIKTAFQENK